MPERTRSDISDRSNSAIAEMTVNIALPIGELVSICSVIEMKSTPRCRNSSSASISGYPFNAGQLGYDWRYSKTPGMPVTGGHDFRALKPLWHLVSRLKWIPEVVTLVYSNWTVQPMQKE